MGAGSDVTARDGTGGGDGDGGTEGSAGDGAPEGAPDTAPPGCDTSAEPKDAPLCVTNEAGIFVDGAKGADGNAGTKEMPLKSIAAGIAKGAAGMQKRVYVCEGAYPEHVVLDAAHDGVSLFGGWACGTWVYTGTKAKVAPVDAGYALRVSALAGAVVVADLDFAARDAGGQDATGAGNSSVAAFVSASKGVTLRRVALTAGSGAPGANAAPPATNLYAGDSMGGAAAGVTGGPAKTCACPSFGSSTGGKGGNAGDPAEPGGAGTTNPVGFGTGGAGFKTIAMLPNACGAGVIGANGTPRAGGAPATSFGLVSAQGWSPGAAPAGQEGNPGGGGGGGGGGDVGGAGGGGCGGCGGAAGLGGKGGGASIALLVKDTPITLASCALKSVAAGKGGDGSAAENGGGGGGGGNVGACGGGAGGNGAGGGGGAGGTGGLSLGIGYAGTSAPTVDGATTTTLGAPGVAGAPGGGGQGPGTPGVAGAAGKAGSMGRCA